MRSATRLVLALLCTIVPALAQETPTERKAGSFAELPAQLQRGDRVKVRDVEGSWLSGRFEGASGTTFRLERSRGNVLDLSDSMISEIRRKRPERAWDGVLIGLGVGLGLAVVGTPAACGDDPECSVYTALVFYPTFVGGGAALGAIIDRAISKYDTVYTRSRVDASSGLKLSPYVTSTEKGIRLSLSF